MGTSPRFECYRRSAFVDEFRKPFRDINTSKRISYQRCYIGTTSADPTAQAAITSASAADLEILYDKIAWRIMPFLVLLFVVAWMDRINIGFARLQMVNDLGFSDAVYGFGAGIFYFGYLLFEIPSNLVLERIGARKTSLGSRYCGA